ncbi:hypothetical protein F66182_10948 [Fusarium sp. NRRL 66182]|nr:hypothetical protein F66182_10948 [Fusarium sp. NRRL 66182]
MRFTSFFVAGAFATMAAAQTAVSMSPAQQSQMDCLEECDDGDVKCQSYCITVPSPNEANVNATNECVANCDQGDGSDEETQRYSVCLQGCIADNYWKSVDGTPRETDAADSGSRVSSAASAASATGTATGTATDDDSATATDDATDADSTDDASETGTDDASGTESGSAAAATETGNAAPVIVGGVSFLGLAAAILAL